MTRKPYKYKIGQEVLIKYSRKWHKHVIEGKMSAGGIKAYRLSGGALKNENEISPLPKK